jgi:hypothetical protein
MGFETLVQRITYKINGRETSGSGLFVPSTNQYDYAIGGIPFLSATNDTRPDTEKPVQQRKQQFDSFHDPGEQSLNQWWLRSQTTFTGGAGIVYQDPDTAGISAGTSANLRYGKSIGVDPFSVPGLVTLLNEVNQSVNYTTTANTSLQVAAYVDGSNQSRVWLVNDNGDVVSGTLLAGDIDSANQRTGTIGPSVQTGAIIAYKAPNDNFSGKPRLYAFSDSGIAGNDGLWRVQDNNGAALITDRIYKPPSIFSTLVGSMMAGRGFINVGAKNLFYQLDPNAAVDTAWPAAVATLPLNQSIISITDGPDAIYVAANSDQAGYIYKTTFSNTGSVNGLTQVAILPNGERINNIAAYVATYMVISTMTTIRVAQFTGSGISYGPAIITVPIDRAAPGFVVSPGNYYNSSGFGAITFFGTNAYVATQTSTSQHDGAQGIIAINLGVILQDRTTSAQFNPYSTWVYSPLSTDKVISLTTDASGRIIYTTAGPVLPGTAVGKLWVQHSTRIINTGYLDTGRCRFNTLEPKLFKFFSIKTPVPLQGNLTVSVLGDDGSLTNYVTYGPTGTDPGTSDIATPVPPGPRNWEALRFTFNRSVTDDTKCSQMDSWQIKALPGTLKQRTITRQFLCFNSQKDKGGQTVTGDTQALDQLTAIRQMCQRGDTVTFQDLVNNISDQVIIDDYQFTMLATPGPNKENYGGYLTVMMRTVADSVPPISFAGTVVDV